MILTQFKIYRVRYNISTYWLVYYFVRKNFDFIHKVLKKISRPYIHMLIYIYLSNYESYKIHIKERLIECRIKFNFICWITIGDLTLKFFWAYLFIIATKGIWGKGLDKKNILRNLHNSKTEKHAIFMNSV